MKLYCSNCNKETIILDGYVFNTLTAYKRLIKDAALWKKVTGNPLITPELINSYGESIYALSQGNLCTCPIYAFSVRGDYIKYYSRVFYNQQKQNEFPIEHDIIAQNIYKTLALELSFIVF